MRSVFLWTTKSNAATADDLVSLKIDKIERTG